MSSHFANLVADAAYLDRQELLRSLLTEEEFRAERHALLQHSTTVYVGNLSFYTRESQLMTHFAPCGHVRDLVMGLNESTRSPCGFCFIVYETHEAAQRAVQQLHHSVLDDRVLSVSWDVGCAEVRRWGRGASGGQVVDGVRQNVDDGRGGLGVLRRGALGIAPAVGSTRNSSGHTSRHDDSSSHRNSGSPANRSSETALRCGGAVEEWDDEESVRVYAWVPARQGKQAVASVRTRR